MGRGRPFYTLKTSLRAALGDSDNTLTTQCGRAAFGNIVDIETRSSTLMIVEIRWSDSVKSIWEILGDKHFSRKVRERAMKAPCIRASCVVMFILLVKVSMPFLGWRSGWSFMFQIIAP